MEDKSYCPTCEKEIGPDYINLIIDHNSEDKVNRLVGLDFCGTDCLLEAMTLGTGILDKYRYDGEDKTGPRPEMPPIARERQLKRRIRLLIPDPKEYCLEFCKHFLKE